MVSVIALASEGASWHRTKRGSGPSRRSPKRSTFGSSPAGGRALATFRTGWRERKLCSKTDDGRARVLEHELAQLPGGRTAKAVNGLRFVAYDGEAAAHLERALVLCRPEGR